MSAVFHIAALVLLEARRTRLPWLLLLTLSVVAGAAVLAGATAITETVQVRSTIAAAGLRLALVFLMALFVTASMVRAIDDKQIELFLAMPISRTQIVLGRALGYVLVAQALALTGALVLIAFAPVDALLMWLASLSFELMVVALIALLCTLSFAQVTAGFAFTMAFYVLARSMDALMLMANSPLANQGGLADEIIAGVLNAIAFVLPPIGRMTEAGWLSYGAPDLMAVGALCLQAGIFGALVLAASLIDFSRRAF